jgi:hypothetical protein
MADNLRNAIGTDLRDPLPVLVKWTAWGTVVQLAMVVTGHYNGFIKEHVFAIGGMGISMVFGAFYAKATAGSKSSAALCGLMVGGASAFLGIAVSALLGDVPAIVLAFGTIGSALAGLIGGVTLYAIAGTKNR